MRIDRPENGKEKSRQLCTRRCGKGYAPKAPWLPAFLLSAALCLSACATIDGLPARGVDEAADDGALAHDLDLIVDKAVADGFGGQVAIMRYGVLVYSRAGGYADQGGEIPVREDTLYHVASLTKFATAILTLKAIEEGELSLDDTASALFPQTPLAVREFTLRDLLDHLSGLRSTYAAEDESDGATALAAIAAANQGNISDGEFHYSNDAYDLLSILLERIYAAPYEAIFRKMIAAPAELVSFGFWGEARLDDPAVIGQPVGEVSEKLKRRNYGMIGSAGLLISARDLVRLRLALDNGEILGRQMVAELNAPREEISIGNVLFGAFLVETPLGPAISARGSEDWGDNAYLNHYEACDLNIAITTSRGPVEGSGAPLFRDSLISAVEEKLEPRCRALN